MSVRALLALTSLLAVAVVAPGAAVAKQGGADRPWKGSGSGTSTFNVAISPFPATGEGTARFAHLGKSTFSSNYTITLTGPTTFSVAGTQTIVAANGDMLFMTFTGTGVTTGAFGVGQTSETTVVYTVTGGTGRFADADGTLTGTISSEVVSIVGATATISQTFDTSGTIGY
jgi:hypothetical protein